MKTSELYRIIFSFFLLAIIFWNVGSTIFQQRNTYLSHDYWQRFTFLKIEYNNSQYVNKHPKGWIPDEAVNAYAGGAYMQGVLPQLIAPDTPPLGRYLIGLSGKLFGNENIIILISFTVTMVLMYVLGVQVFSNKVVALVPIVLLTREPIFLNQLIYTPLLDIIQLAFLLGFFTFFNRAQISQSKLFWYIASSICLGCFIATKFFITGLTILAAGILVLILRRYVKNAILFIVSSSVSVVILLLTYVTSFFHGYSFKAFLGIQKWIFLYHKSQLILPFSIWPLLLFNKWYVWYGKIPILSDPQWRFTWPLITLISCITTIMYLLRKIQNNASLEILLAWVVCYVGFFSFGQISSRYFVILLPIFYIISVYGVWQLVLLCVRRKPKKEIINK